MLRCNLPPALLAEWLGSFPYHCGNTGVERTPNKSQHTKLSLEKKILPPLLPGLGFATFWSWVWRPYQQALPALSLVHIRGLYYVVCLHTYTHSQLQVKSFRSASHRVKTNDVEHYLLLDKDRRQNRIVQEDHKWDKGHTGRTKLKEPPTHTHTHTLTQSFSLWNWGPLPPPPHTHTHAHVHIFCINTAARAGEKKELCCMFLSFCAAFYLPCWALFCEERED